MMNVIALGYKLETYGRFIFLAMSSGNDDVERYKYIEVFGDYETILTFKGSIIQFLTSIFTKCPPTRNT